MNKKLFLLFTLMLLMLCVPVWGDDKELPAPTVAPVGYAQLWIDETGLASVETLKATLAELKEQEPNPEQIFVFIHGFDDPRDYTTNEYNELVQRIQEQYKDHPTRLGMVGLQWDSAVTGSILSTDKVYFEKIPLARSIGRNPARHLLFALQDRHPKAHITLLAHSMGCEIAAAALLPEISYADYEPFVDTYLPAKTLKISMMVLAGSDLDYDFWYKSQLPGKDLTERCGLTWATMSDYLGKGDKVLNVRGKIRGKAGGAAFPRMTLDQLNQTVSRRQWYLDHQNIPRDHLFQVYYDSARLKNLVAALRFLTEKGPKPKAFAELDQVLAAPDDLNILLPYLDSENYAVKFYALWRIEKINDGDARHMTDLTLEKIATMLKDHPQQIWREMKTTDCVTVRKGQFPTEKTMIKAGAPPWANKEK